MSAPYPREAYPAPRWSFDDDEVKTTSSDTPEVLLMLLECETSDIAADLRARVRSLLALEDDWNGYGAPAPSAEAGDRALAVVSACEEVGLLPERIVADADGGISIYFVGAERIAGGASRRRGCIQVENDGAVEGFLDDRSDPNARQFFEFNAHDSKEAEDAVSRIQAFIV